MTFCGQGVSLEFARRESVCEVVEIDLYGPRACDIVRQLSVRFDYGLSIMEPLFVQFLDGEIPLGYVDSLSWMWCNSHFEQYPTLRTLKHYFYQDTFNSLGNLEKHGVRNLRKVGAILDLPTIRRTRTDAVLLHFGGVENIYVAFAEQVYPIRMMALLAQQAFFKHSRDVHVVSGIRARDAFAGLYPDRRHQFVSLPHMQFMRAVSTASRLLTSPGLTTLLEAFALQTPVIFLPPQNYSQYLIMDRLTRWGYPRVLLNWSHIYPYFRIDDDVPEENAVRAIADISRRFFDDPDAVVKLSRETALQLDQDTHDILQFQERFIDGIGVRGAEDVSCAVIGGTP